MRRESRRGLMRFLILACFTLFATVSGATAEGVEYETTHQIKTKKAYALAYENRYLYVADDRGGLKVIRMEEGSEPSLIGSFVRSGVRYLDVEVNGGVVYAAAYDKGVDLIDVSDPTHPRLITTVETKDRALSLDLSEDTLYIADRRGGVWIVDVGDSDQPRILAQLRTSQAQDVLVSGDRLYIADGKKGIKIADISDKSAPKIVGSLPLEDKAKALSLEGDTLYVALRFAGAAAVDVSNPAKPALRSIQDTEGKAIGVSYRDGALYVSDSANGLVILDASTLHTIQRIATAAKLRDVLFVGNSPVLAISSAGVAVLEPKAPPAPEAIAMDPLSQATWSTLDEASRLYVAHKLFATLYYNVSPHEFKELATAEDFPSRAWNLFTREADSAQRREVESKLDYFTDYDRGDAGRKMISKMLARLYLLEPSKVYFDYWTSYVLTQTILFSPALELKTVQNEDAELVYYDLYNDIAQGLSIADSTYNHMITQSNWRRFRSPEDNGREMLEIYLMDFEDAHVPLAAKALQNWHLDRQGTLIIGDNENTEPITDLFPGKTIVNGYDYYEALVDDPRFLPTVTRRLVQIYFPNFSAEDQEKIVNGILARRPVTWSDLMRTIVFSETYLLRTKRLKWYEEIFFPAIKALPWVPKAKTFEYTQLHMNQMHQSSMRYKLGRPVTAPADTEALGWKHSDIRKQVFLNPMGNTDPASFDDGIVFNSAFAYLPDELMLEDEYDENGKRTDLWAQQERVRSDYLVERYITTLAGRFATDEEKRRLGDMIDREVYDKEHFKNRALIDLYRADNPENTAWGRGQFVYWVLDYVSRLSHTYEFYDLQGGAQ